MIPRNKTDKMGWQAAQAFKEAVAKALKLHQRLGVPAVYMRKGKIVYLLPNGKVVDKPPVSKSSKRK